jgi:putative sporulation protein YtaF
LDFLAILLFALAVSTDGFMVGVAYGIKKIRVPMLSLAVIAVASALAVTVSMVCGQGLSALFSERVSSSIGALLLITIGIFFLGRAVREGLSQVNGNSDELLTLKVRPLGIIIKILKEPSSADLDSSGEISPRESFFLGLALALDALGAGAGVAMAGFNIPLTALCVGGLKLVLINLGVMIAAAISSKYVKNVSSVLPGIIFIFIGIGRFI